MIATWWAVFAAAVGHNKPDVPPVQVTECRRAFYAGAISMFTGIVNAMGEGTEPTEADLRFMDRLKAEIDSYGRHLERAVAREERKTT